MRPWTVAYQAPPSMGFSRQESWSGLPFPSPEDLPDPGIEPGLPHCRQALYRLSHQGSPTHIHIYIYLSLTAWGRSCSMQDLHCLMCNLSLQCSDSLVVGHGLSSLWHTGLAAPGHVEILVLWQGIEPTTPASQGVFFTTESPRKSLYYCLFIASIFLFFVKLFFKNQHNFFLWC